MLYSSEHLLQCLQRFSTSSFSRVKQVQAIAITNGYLHFHPCDTSRLKWRSVLLFNGLIRGYLDVGKPYKALLLFSHMLAHRVPPNNFTLTFVVKAAYLSLSSIAGPMGRSLHSQVIKRGVGCDPFLQTSLISFYACCGSVSEARLVFEEIDAPCVVAHNAMLDVFAKHGEMCLAVSLFERMLKRDVYSWTSVINGFCRNELFQEAIGFFRRMMLHEDVIRGIVRPNEATLVSILSSCANIDSGRPLYVGEQLHGYIVKNGITSVFTWTALISFYGKVGCVVSARKVFECLDTKNVCAWNAIICSLALNAEESLAMDILEKMKQDRIWPNEVTFVAILTACSRAKLVDLGLDLFRSMSQDFGIVPKMEHYGCVVDLLGRAGLLAEADRFIERMPFEPDDTVLGALLGACKLHGAIELGDKVGRRLLELQPRHCGQHVALWNINASMGKWEPAAELRRAMAEAGISKVQALSLV